MVKKIISGAQTGADQAGLCAAEALGLETGGTVPKGRRTCVGPLSDKTIRRWNLVEDVSSAYPPRTERNVIDSDGTVIFGNLNSPGSKLTIKLCKKHLKPYMTNPLRPQELKDWADTYHIQVLNVAGNREETNHGIFANVRDFLIEAFKDGDKQNELENF
jgi:hypothetical protein